MRRSWPSRAPRRRRSGRRRPACRWSLAAAGRALAARAAARGRSSATVGAGCGRAALARSARRARWPCGSPRPRPGAPPCARRPRGPRPPRPPSARSPPPRGGRPPRRRARRRPRPRARTRSSSTCCQAARPERITSPIAPVMTAHDFIASSLPGITYCDAVRVDVGVDKADDRDPQALGLLDRDRLRLEVDDEHRVRRALHVLDAAEVGLQLGEVGLRAHALLRRQQLELALGLEALEVVQALDALRDRLEVREHAAQPAVVDVRHARSSRRPP